MNTDTTTSTSGWIFRQTGWREATALLAASWLVPVLVHLVPWAGSRPLGVYVLPVFWTTFVAAYFYGALPGLLVGLVTPALNLLLTGLPALRSVGLMSGEVAVFALAAGLMMARWAGFRFTAPLAYVAAKAVVIILGFVLAASGEAENPLQHFARSMQNSVAGLAVLAGINALLVAFCPRTDVWEKE